MGARLHGVFLTDGLSVTGVPEDREVPEETVGAERLPEAPEAVEMAEEEEMAVMAEEKEVIMAPTANVAEAAAEALLIAPGALEDWAIAVLPIAMIGHAIYTMVQLQLHMELPVRTVPLEETGVPALPVLVEAQLRVIGSRAYKHNQEAMAMAARLDAVAVEAEARGAGVPMMVQEMAEAEAEAEARGALAVPVVKAEEALTVSLHMPTTEEEILSIVMLTRVQPVVEAQEVVAAPVVTVASEGMGKAIVPRKSEQAGKAVTVEKAVTVGVELADSRAFL